MLAGQLKRGETILITGAAGAVGSAAVQIANSIQARVLGAAIDSAEIPGAEAVIDTNKEDLRERVLSLTGGRGVDMVFDTVGGPVFEPSLRSLRHGGRQVAIASTGGTRVSFDLVDFYHSAAHLIGVDSTNFEPNELKMIMNELNRGFESGALHTPALECNRLESAVEAYNKVANRTGNAKQILTP